MYSSPVWEMRVRIKYKQDFVLIADSHYCWVRKFSLHTGDEVSYLPVLKQPFILQHLYYCLMQAGHY